MLNRTKMLKREKQELMKKTKDKKKLSKIKTLKIETTLLQDKIVQMEYQHDYDRHILSKLFEKNMIDKDGNPI